MLISSLIFPLLDYCCLLYKDLTAEQNVQLQRLINCSMKFILNLRRDEHITPYRRYLGWLTVGSRRLYFFGIMTYKILHFDAPGYLLELFSPCALSQRPSRQLTPSVFVIPLFRTLAYRNSFFLSAIYFWHFLYLLLPLRVWASSSSASLNIFLRVRPSLHSVILFV